MISIETCKRLTSGKILKVCRFWKQKAPNLFQKWASPCNRCKGVLHSSIFFKRAIAQSQNELSKEQNLTTAFCGLPRRIPWIKSIFVPWAPWWPAPSIGLFPIRAWIKPWLGIHFCLSKLPQSFLMIDLAIWLQRIFSAHKSVQSAT